MTTWADLGIDEARLGPGNVKLPCPSCGPTRNHPNDPSLSVNRDEGIYKCHNCNWAGSLKSRDHIQSGPDFKQKVEQQAWRKPDAARFRAETTTDLPSYVLAYFKGRGISEATLRNLGVAFGPGHDFGFFRALKPGEPGYEPNGRNQKWEISKGKGGDPVRALYFPYSMDGELVNIKKRLWSDGTAQKDFRLTKGALKIFWNIDEADETTIIVEGEIDLLTLHECGYYNAVSVPNGASVSEYLDACAEKLSKVKRFILMVDGDEAGQKLRDELARRLGKENCMVVEYPPETKDINEVLVRYGRDEVDRVVRSARFLPVDGLVELADVSDEIDYYYEHGMPTGLTTGFPSLDPIFRVGPGAFVIVTGKPGHGKSSVLAQMLLHMAELHDIQVGVFSPEDNPTSAFMIKLLSKRVGKPFEPGKPNRMTPEEMVAAKTWVNEHFVAIAPSETTFSVDEILRLARVAVYRRGIRVLVIDPWNEVDHNRPARLSEGEYISQVLSKLRIFARMHDCAVFLVAHPRKTEKIKTKDGEMIEAVVDLEDVAGCYAEDTEILSMGRGWIRHDQWMDGEEIACFDPGTSTLRYATPSKLWEYDYDGEMAHFKAPAMDTLVTPDHTMVVRPQWRIGQKSGGGQVQPWEFVPANGIGTRNVEIPYATPFESGYRDIPYLHLDDLVDTDDLMRLVGWYVSEGSVSQHSIQICQGEGPIADEMKATLDRMRIQYSERFGPPRRENETKTMWIARLYARQHPRLVRWIIDSCGGDGAISKRLPLQTWSLSRRQQRILLHALLQGDGCEMKRGGAPTGNWVYSTCSPQLADDVQRLAIELGHGALVTPLGRGKPHHMDHYTVAIGKPERRARYLRTKRHLEMVPYTGKVYCFTTPWGAYLTRRNGKMAIAGNSYHFRAKADIGLTVWRDVTKTGPDALSKVYVTKCRQPWYGRTGVAEFTYEPGSGRIVDPLGGPKPIISAAEVDDIFGGGL